MGDDGRERFLTALTTEHFVLQTSASATISEGSSRSSLYLLSLSSSLVALTFAAQAPGDVFAPFAAAVLPTLFLLGWFTVVRLVDVSIENVQYLRRIHRIRRYYATLAPDAGEFFPALDVDDGAGVEQMLGVSFNRGSLWYTMAGLVGVVNGVLGGTALALLVEGVLGGSRPVAVVVGVVAAVFLAVSVLLYQRRRFAEAFSRA